MFGRVGRAIGNVARRAGAAVRGFASRMSGRGNTSGSRSS